MKLLHQLQSVMLNGLFNISFLCPQLFTSLTGIAGGIYEDAHHHEKTF